MVTTPGKTRLAIHDLDRITDGLARSDRNTAPGRAQLVAISGIDGSGKSTIAARLKAALEDRGLRTALVPLDPWHAPAGVRFARRHAAARFYEHAFRWEALFGELVDPLVRARSIRLLARQLRLVDDAWYEHRFAFDDIDVVLLEGIFLFKREHRARYDATLWIDCPFEIALRPALAPNQEGVPPARLIADYRRIYFPAQRVHDWRDDPRGFAPILLLND